MTKLTLAIALAALGLGGYLASNTCGVDRRMDDIEQGVRDVSDAIADLDTKLDHAIAAAAHRDPELLSAAASEAPGDGQAGDGATLAARAPATPGERLSALERTVAAQRETIAGLEEKAAGQPTAAPQLQSRFFGNNDAYYRNLDAASDALELSERQKADMQDSIDVAKRELQDLYDTQNEDGETWNEIRKGKMRTIGGGGSGITFSIPDFKKIAKFKQAKVPGTSETFGAAEKRIRKDTFADMRRGLTPDQSKKWDKAQKDQLLGPGSTGGAIYSTIQIETLDK